MDTNCLYYICTLVLQYVSGTFESDLEAALMQSKLDYQQQQTRLQQESQPKTKAKKKPVAVPLGEFHAMLNNVSYCLLS